MGAPLLCSRLTESGPLSAADSTQRLVAFELNWILYPNAKSTEKLYHKVKIRNFVEVDWGSVMSRDMPQVIVPAASVCRRGSMCVVAGT